MLLKPTELNRQLDTNTNTNTNTNAITMQHTFPFVQELKGFLKKQTLKTWSDFLRIFGITDNPRRTFESQRKNLTVTWVHRKHNYVTYLSFIELFKATH